jgi:hypothetical protein
MKQIVFYSWQSDLPNACNRGFIQEALENAAAEIKADDTVAVEPVVDRDTQGVPGAPDIASTIFAKITAADVFVADISIVVGDQKRATPNPNVLIELGYAMKALGHERVILVFNRAFGKIEDLPFDLRMRRVLAYELPEGQTKSTQKKALEKQLNHAIRAAVENNHKSVESVPIAAISAIEARQPNRIVVLRRDLDEILKNLDALQPTRHSEGGTVDQLIAAINLTQETIAGFSKIAEAIAVINDTEAALDLYRWFGRIFERYIRPENFNGRSSNADQDFFKFIGHELFVTFVAFLIREQRWDMLRTILAEPIPTRYVPGEHGPGNVYWHYITQHLPSILDESSRRHRLSLHADILNERHTTGGLAAIMPMDDFTAADYFLFLLGDMAPEALPEFMDWRPWSTLYLKTTPQFLRNAEQKRVADQIIKLFNISSFDEFKKRYTERAPRLARLFSGGFWINPVSEKDVSRFGTR